MPECRDAENAAMARRSRHSRHSASQHCDDFVSAYPNSTTNGA
jgi:hypothetical protein